VPATDAGGGATHRAAAAGVHLLPGVVRPLPDEAAPVSAPSGVLAAVVAAVRAAPGTGLHDIAAHVRVESGVPAGRSDVADALVCLHLVGAVTKAPGGRWSPGPWSLEELPLPLATLERDWARERRRRVKHAHRYR
jgi:hypothetical protein